MIHRRFTTLIVLLIALAVHSPLCTATEREVTFNKQIAPIIFNNCASCHRPGAAAPFSLLSYQDVAKRAKLISSVTRSRYMPPWKAEHSSIDFSDQRRLSDIEIALLDQVAVR